MSRPLRSAPIAGVSSLLRAGPPACAATVLGASRFLPLGALPLAPAALRTAQALFRHMPSHVPCRSRRPGSRRLYAGHRLASKRAPARLIPGLGERPGFDVMFAISTLQQRFTCVRLPDLHLTPHGRLFLIAHHARHSTGAA